MDAEHRQLQRTVRPWKRCFITWELLRQCTQPEQTQARLRREPAKGIDLKDELSVTTPILEKHGF